MAGISEERRKEMEEEMSRFEQEISMPEPAQPVGAEGPPPAPINSCGTCRAEATEASTPSTSTTSASRPTNASVSKAETLKETKSKSSKQSSHKAEKQKSSDRSAEKGRATDKSAGGEEAGTSKKRKKEKRLLRTAGQQTWEDSSLNEWDTDDFRIFCGDLGNDVTDEVLIRVFGKFPSFLKAKVVRDKRTNKSKGYGFASFKDPGDFIKAMREINGK
ncbi:hypothetical protein MRX96_034695 [Rhipicephalus microplus]